MTIYRVPIAGRPLPKLDCVGGDCIKERKKARKGRTHGYFNCPGKQTGQCETRAHGYPRFKRTSEQLEKYLKQRKLEALPPEEQFHFHVGIDLGKMNDTIISVVRGKVHRVVDRWTRGFTGYGKCVIIQAHESYGALGGLFFFHAHCLDILVKEGDDVEEQQPIAIAGNTDYSESDPTSTYPEASAHLHFEVSRWARDVSTVFHERAPEYVALERERGKPPVYCEDPLQILEQLGPWGPREVYFPDGRTVNEASRRALHREIVSHAEGGYFPLGANNMWHGGVHLLGERGSTLVAPLPGEVVACRLGESDATSLREYGSTNFILLRHSLNGVLTSKLPGEQRTAGTERVVLKKGDNAHPALVKELKRLLNAVHDDADQPLYAVSSSAGLDDGTFDQALEDAVKVFQGRDDPASGQPLMRNPDGQVTVGGLTWNALHQTPPLQRPDHGEANDVSQLTFYTLIMHLDAVPIQSMQGKAKWLTDYAPEADAEPEPTPEATTDSKADVEDTPEDRAFRPTSHVGKPPPEVADEPWNAPDDVRWLKRRLTVHGHYQEPDFDSPAVTDALLEAITAFHGTRPAQFRPPAQYPYVAVSGGSIKLLAQPKQAAGTSEAGGGTRPKARTIDPQFLRRLQEIDNGSGLAQVVSGLNIKVSAGDVLWQMGQGIGYQQGSTMPKVHWGMFSEKVVLPDFETFDDPDDDLTVDGFDEALTKLADGHDDFREDPADGRIDREALAKFYAEPGAAFLRRVQVRFRSEWGLDPDKVLERLEKDGRFDVDETLPKKLAAYTFWEQASDVLPRSPKVWHYHPVELMYEYANRTGMLDAILEIVVTRFGAGAERLEVRVRRGAVEETARVGLGEATRMRLTVGVAEVSLFEPGGPDYLSFTQSRELPAMKVKSHLLHLTPGSQRLELYLE